MIINDLCADRVIFLIYETEREGKNMHRKLGNIFMAHQSAKFELTRKYILIKATKMCCP